DDVGQRAIDVANGGPGRSGQEVEAEPVDGQRRVPREQEADEDEERDAAERKDARGNRDRSVEQPGQPVCSTLSQGGRTGGHGQIGWPPALTVWSSAMAF